MDPGKSGQKPDLSTPWEGRGTRIVHQRGFLRRQRDTDTQRDTDKPDNDEDGGRESGVDSDVRSVFVEVSVSGLAGERKKFSSRRQG